MPVRHPATLPSFFGVASDFVLRISETRARNAHLTPEDSHFVSPIAGPGGNLLTW
jgi:hypothetical protein